MTQKLETAVQARRENLQVTFMGKHREIFPQTGFGAESLSQKGPQLRLRLRQQLLIQ